ncbi:hypothetical protein B0H13DRAFT_2312221 [Mycena leptocephala]|nr:hypothetical protein B0H13DRAFT_2312221 [Mycena leptocephala]
MSESNRNFGFTGTYVYSVFGIVKEWAGPLILVSGTNVTFNGNGHTLFGQGDLYWDGLGGNGGVTKPAPFIRVNNAGSFSNVRILNAPERSIAVKGSPVKISGITIGNSLGDLLNSRSNGLPAGHNTDESGSRTVTEVSPIPLDGFIINIWHWI